MTQHLEDAMTKRGFTSNEALAARLQVPVSTVENLRHGRSQPSPGLLKRLCRVLNVRSDKLCLLDKSLYSRITGATANDPTPSDALAPPEPVEPASEQEKCTQFANEVLSLLANGRQIIPELRAEYTKSARGFYWLDQLSPERAAETLRFDFESDLKKKAA